MPTNRRRRLSRRAFHSTNLRLQSSMRASRVMSFDLALYFLELGLEIETTYEPIRRYIIESLTMPKSGTGTDDAEGTMAVKEYYRSKHGIELQFPHMHVCLWLFISCLIFEFSSRCVTRGSIFQWSCVKYPQILNKFERNFIQRSPKRSVGRRQYPHSHISGQPLPCRIKPCLKMTTLWVWWMPSELGPWQTWTDLSRFKLMHVFCLLQDVASRLFNPSALTLISAFRANIRFTRRSWVAQPIHIWLFVPQIFKVLKVPGEPDCQVFSIYSSLVNLSRDSWVSQAKWISDLSTVQMFAVFHRSLSRLMAFEISLWRSRLTSSTIVLIRTGTRSCFCSSLEAVQTRCTVSSIPA